MRYLPLQFRASLQGGSDTGLLRTGAQCRTTGWQHVCQQPRQWSGGVSCMHVFVLCLAEVGHCFQNRYMFVCIPMNQVNVIEKF